ncbi:hypothetical protein [Mycolicibacterium fallax]|uniref:hypothetical protein n=1 Tax=Mycolicibacterium fallax TaxID=1793 RepID=UPI0013D144E7|nr:hypothetical protein [Mycolicibacterium fallax]
MVTPLILARSAAVVNGRDGVSATRDAPGPPVAAPSARAATAPTAQPGTGRAGAGVQG